MKYKDSIIISKIVTPKFINNCVGLNIANNIAISPITQIVILFLLYVLDILQKIKRSVIIENDYKTNINRYDTVKTKKSNPYINPNDAYEIKKPNQQSLFDEENDNSIFSDVTKVTDDGAAYKEVPLIITKIYDDQVTEKKKSNKQIDEKVEKLFRQGMNVDDIAAELSCSIAEVQFIIDML